ncbi:NAD(P)/FAD-dependent oxidoreductase [Streptomyces sp. NPDC001985]|uniref:phytoene desaturase family protein n=1 Tax=Streptomyces sp. NPDC001985 TaxID=3154406 RepID=UPI00332D1F09
MPVHSSPLHSSYDAVIVGGGHNGLVAAAYLARAGRSVLVLERAAATGGAAVSTRPFAGVDARLSRYSYLVSLLPGKIVRDLGIAFSVRRRTVSSYTPAGSGGLLVGAGRTRESFAALTGDEREYTAWRDFHAMTARVARRVFPTLTGPLPTRGELRERIDDERAWRLLFEEPLGVAVEEWFSHDLVRGVVLTDALIGTFADAHDPSLIQNRCFLYHVIGGGTGDWDVPVGGMGALTDALAAAARDAGAEIVTRHEATAIETDGTDARVAFRALAADGAGRAEGAVGARRVLVNASPTELAALLGEEPPPAVEGAQFKVNMVVRRLPRLRDHSVDPRDAFAGTFHVSEGYTALARAYREAASGRLPGAPPSELYCHSLTDPSILGPRLAAEGCQTLTLFGLHTPARLFAGDHDATRAALLAATLAELDTHLEEPIESCLATDENGEPCVEAKSPLDLERELRLPGGHIFHRDLAFPYADDAPAGRWGVATRHPNVLLCGAGAVRGGGVSGIPGHNAAMAALGH